MVLPRRRERELEEQETQARLERYRKQRGGVKPAIEQQQEDNIRESLQNSRAYMMRGMYKEAVEVRMGTEMRRRLFRASPGTSYASSLSLRP